MAPAWWDRKNHEARRSLLVTRSRAIQAIRKFFVERDFFEVQTPVLQRSPGVERHIKPIPVQVHTHLNPTAHSRYLHSSPEFAMKKLLAAGEERIFQICPVFRDGEAGRLHQPEFTMLEWYRSGATYTAVMEDLETLVREVAAFVQADQLRHGDLSWPVSEGWRKFTVADVFADFAGVDILSGLSRWDEDVTSLRRAATEAGIECGDDETWDDVFHRILLDKVDPQLKTMGALFLYDYPYPAGALARNSQTDPRVCERVEAYVCGVELANGFSELTDAAEQRRRFDSDRRLYADRYGSPPPIDEDFLRALAEIPEATGMAMGIDRLVMLLTGAPRITDVQWAPVDLNES